MDGHLYDTIRGALYFISAHDRALWLRIGMAVKSLGDDGFDLWDEWSRTADNYDPKAARTTWRSITPDGGVTLGTLYHEAQQYGFRFNGETRPQPPTADEIAERDRREQENEGARQRAHEDAAKKALAILAAATADPVTHPYVLKKRVSLGALVKRGPWTQRGWNDALLVPIYGINGRLWSIEAINADGDKDFLASGKTAGGFHPFGKIRGAGRVLIGEGVATVAVGAEVDQSPAAAALCTSNLKAVALAVRELAAPGADIIILADNDVKPDGSNPGIEGAMESARSIGARVAIPELDGRKCDFWDMWNELGVEAVERAIANAKPPARADPQPHAGGSQDKGSGAQSGEDDWPEPQSLPDGLPHVAAFDFALLPETLRPWVEDTCARVQCPPDFMGVSVVTALGTVLGRKIGIRPQAYTDWTTTPNQWAILIGRPGVLKSPAIEAALAPLNQLVAKALAAHEKEMADYEVEVRIAKLTEQVGEKKARDRLGRDPAANVSDLLKSTAPAAPIMRRYRTNDSSAAALGELHRQNPNGLLVVRDELVSLLAGLDREDHAEGRGFYLTGWNGDSPYTIDRIGRGMNLHIPAVCLSLLGSTQPGRIAGYIRSAVRGGVGDDGLLQRFGLLVWPDTSSDWVNVDRCPESAAKRAAYEVFEQVDRLTPEAASAHQDRLPDGAPDGLPYLRFDPAGLEVFTEWRETLEHLLRSGGLHPAMESHLAKYRKLVPGLALIMHFADGGTGSVSEKSTLQALAWAEYLESHAQRAYASVTAPRIATAKAIIAQIRKGALPRTFASWNIWRKGWALLSDREEVAEALSLLCNLDWLRVSEKRTTGRTASVYEVNPRAVPV